MRFRLEILTSLPILAIALVLVSFVGCTGGSGPERFAYTLEYEVTGTAPSVNISAFIPDGTDVGPVGAVGLPWSHTETGTVDNNDPLNPMITRLSQCQKPRLSPVVFLSSHNSD